MGREHTVDPSSAPPGVGAARLTSLRSEESHGALDTFVHLLTLIYFSLNLVACAFLTSVASVLF